MGLIYIKIIQVFMIMWWQNIEIISDKQIYLQYFCRPKLPEYV